MKNQTINTIGFIGLGVMGNSMCKNLLQNKKWSIMVNDLNKNKEEDLHNHGAIIASDIEDLFDKSDVIITCLPGGSFVYEMYFGKQNIISFIKPNQYIVDMSTSQPDLMVKLNIEIKKKNSFFADAPIGKTRQAAIDGTLAIMVGSNLDTFKHLLPIFNLMGEDIMHCGDVGSGQLTKIMNNMILFETVVALSEAANIAEKYGMNVSKLFNNLTKCSGDSFALKNHGIKSIAKNHFPFPAFSSEYALKDLSYALELGNKLKIKLPGAETAKKLLQTSIEQGDKDLYFPVIKKYLK
ncbi:NAD(P)-dependent oxidoreductase [Alphaproteobacteria bacterium]|nr:NAD(P)-dependent oxidoreductase [Alphaproteobacteria bacterium]MDC0993743.1 NAD(P)-dependent oxidoreductase [Alphaproteobacteria bacterium]